MSDLVKITLNGREALVDPKKPLIAACHDAGESVPHYCYHPGLTPVGSCRICQVEVKQGEMPPRVVAACRTPVAPGMIVDTEAPKAHEARRQCLEFLLKNHPLDCPICDKAGECTLQDYSFEEGQGEGRSVEPRRKLEKRHSLGDVIVLDQERCILCSRCVRFFDEVTGKAQLCIGQRGSHSVVETWEDRPLTGNYQGNITDLCPVGALTLADFRFQARVWNLYKSASTCGECSRGCSTSVEVLRKGEVKRIRPRHNAEVNQYWMCDHGRFSGPRFNRTDRLTGARIRGGSGRPEAVDVEDALAIARDMLVTHGETLIVASPWLTIEEGRVLLALGKTLAARPVFVSPAESELGDDFLHTGDPCPNRRGLSELGFDGLPASEVLEAMASREVVLIVGERSIELLGADGLAGLPQALRVILLECHPLDAPALDVAIGIPDAVEREGTWINVDGHAGQISAARPAPAGVWATTRLLDRLHALVTRTSEVAS